MKNRNRIRIMYSDKTFTAPLYYPGAAHGFLLRSGPLWEIHVRPGSDFGRVERQCPCDRPQGASVCGHGAMGEKKARPGSLAYRSLQPHAGIAGRSVVSTSCANRSHDNPRSFFGQVRGRRGQYRRSCGA